VAKADKYSLDTLLAIRAVSDQKAVKIREGRAIANARIQSVASATAYLLLVLHQMGLGAVWMTGPMQAKEELEEILKVPEGMDLVAFIPVGYPGENPAPKPRKPLTEVCQIIK
jgi:nitroreductase